MDNYTLSLMVGTDIPLSSIPLIMHQPTILEISYVGEPEFFAGLQTFSLDKNMYLRNLGDLKDKISNFDLIMQIMGQEPEIKKYIFNFLSLIFDKYKIDILPPRTILLSFEDQKIIIDEGNFPPLQEEIRKIFNLDKTDARNFNPVGDKAKAIADKILAGRQKLAAQMAGKEQNSILTQYISILTVGLNSMSLKDCCNLTLFQLWDLVERYQLYFAWDLDIRQKLAGGKPNTSVDNWMKSIH